MFDAHGSGPAECSWSVYESIGFLVVVAFQFLLILVVIRLLGILLCGKNLHGGIIDIIFCVRQNNSSVGYTPRPARPGKKDNAHVV